MPSCTSCSTGQPGCALDQPRAVPASSRLSLDPATDRQPHGSPRQAARRPANVVLPMPGGPTRSMGVSRSPAREAVRRDNANSSPIRSITILKFGISLANACNAPSTACRGRTGVIGSGFANTAYRSPSTLRLSVSRSGSNFGKGTMESGRSKPSDGGSAPGPLPSSPIRLLEGGRSVTHPPADSPSSSPSSLLAGNCPAASRSAILPNNASQSRPPRKRPRRVADASMVARAAMIVDSELCRSPLPWPDALHRSVR